MRRIRDQHLSGFFFDDSGRGRMSIELMSLVWKFPLHSKEKITLLAIADNANDEGYAFPGYAHLIKKTGLARATLAKQLKILREMGLIKQTPHAEIGKGRKVNTYQINIELLKSSMGELIVRKHRKVQGVNSSQERPISSKGELEPSFNRQVKEKNKQKRKIPSNFTISERVRLWAKKKGHTNLEEHLENFVLASKAKGYKYESWDDAFMNAIRNNWAKIQEPQEDYQSAIYREYATGNMGSGNLRDISQPLSLAMDVENTESGYTIDDEGMGQAPWELHS